MGIRKRNSLPLERYETIAESLANRVTGNPNLELPLSSAKSVVDSAGFDRDKLLPAFKTRTSIF